MPFSHAPAHTRPKPGSQSHGSSLPPRRASDDATRDPKIAELPYGWLGDCVAPLTPEYQMPEGPRVVVWRGEQFRFERLKTGVAARSPAWAVWRRGEFIGTMSVAEGETTEEFDVRCVRWLAGLLG